MTTGTRTPPAQRRPGRTRSTGPEQGATERRPAGDQELQLPGRLFDGTGRDRDVRVTRETVDGLEKRQTLWLDISKAGDDEIAAVAELFDLDRGTVRALQDPEGRPRVDVFETYVQVFVNAIDVDAKKVRASGVTLIAGSNFVLTVHSGPIAFIDEFQEHLKGDTPIGLVDALSLLAALLEWHLTAYFRVVEALEEDADELDRRALDPRSERDLLSDLVALRRRVAHVRRELTPHREVFPALTRVDLIGPAESEVANEFRALVDRLERCIDAVEIARELVIGSFDVHMTRTAQRTNEVMKVLTLASVILLPGTLIAGIMGMNFKVSFFEEPMYFGLVVAGIGAIGVTTVVAARLKHWI